MKKVIVIGSGIAGMSAAAVLAKKGHHVTVIEKNDKPGGRINYFSAKGFKFDMGPSWYWMPQVFESFYNRFGFKTSDFYDLKRLDPSYKVIFSNSQAIKMPSDYDQLKQLFESIEPGSAEKLNKFLNHAEYKYKVGMEEFVWKPGKSISEFLDLRVLKSIFKLQMFTPISKEIDKLFRDEKLRQILKFPVLFLGATPEETPALYSLMNYADLKLGTWYPDGGMYNISNAFKKIADSQGVEFVFEEEVKKFKYIGNNIKSVLTESKEYLTDLVVANADYHHIDQNILDPKYSGYSPEYWDSRKLAPSGLLVYLGVNKRVKNLEHHNLFFDADFKLHSNQIYKNPEWPEDPLFYVCCPSKTDDNVAPQGCENLFLLLPIAPNLDGSELLYQKYLNLMIARMESHIGEQITKNIVFKQFFAVQSFKDLYNSYKGNAYGLANTLFQTAILKPSMKSKKISNLFFTGQLTTPGPGLPPAIVSGQVVASEVLKSF